MIVVDCANDVVVKNLVTIDYNEIFNAIFFCELLQNVIIYNNITVPKLEILCVMFHDDIISINELTESKKLLWNSLMM